MTKISELVIIANPSKKNLSEIMTESFCRFSHERTIPKIIQYVADNVFFVTTKTVDARQHDGQWTMAQVGTWLKHSKDRILAEQLKFEIDAWLKP